ncbi:hypothetical protein C5B90_19055 [Haloferax sp. Atlit-12N]|uniref:hypothetical protein n=1 Tax=Haloferax sp. Atlit-12N TaxID=2077203 RepID=UPI000E2338EE|nr:hypothetical protein [Haloferax sp. Atlit-12N]RDZ61373.1 hypothetical protein C5B90_19055 [Haloferax sp. Atlit-12N]
MTITAPNAPTVSASVIRELGISWNDPNSDPPESVSRTWNTDSEWGSLSDVQSNNGTLSLVDNSIVEGFEAGDSGVWTLEGPSQIVSNQSYSGTYSLFTTESSGSSFGVYDFGSETEISDLEFYFRESSTSFGGGVVLEDDSGTQLCGVGSNNPQVDVLDGNGTTEIDSGDGTERWVRFAITSIDWDNETFSVEWEDMQSGSTATSTGHPLANSNGVRRVRLVSHTGNRWGDPSDTVDNWFDDISIGQPERGSADTTTKTVPEEATEADVSSYTATLNGGRVDVEVRGSPGTASEESHTVTLDGSAPSPVTFASSHSEFDLVVTLVAGTSSPTLGSLTVDFTGSGVRVFRSTDDATWTKLATLGFNATSFTDTGLDDGREYFYEVEPFDTASSARSASGSATTILPDAQQPTLGNGVEDEIAVSYQDVINNGLYRLQTRETGASTWSSSALGWDEQALAESTTSTTVTGREDGEEYEVRLRTETSDATGAWTTPVAITTIFPGVTNLNIGSTTKTSVTLEYDINADNEDAVEVYREERRLGNWVSERLVGDLPPDTEPFTDDTVLPETTYRYRVRTFTEHSEAITDWVDVTTPDSGLSKKVPQDGWYVEIDTPSETTLKPEVIETTSEQPRRLPTLNGLPRVELPVARDDKWDSDQLRLADCRVWKDGVRQPIEELTKPRQTPEATVLTARGGRELLTHVEEYVEEQDSHLFVEDLIQTTPYTANVDAPDADVTSDTPMLSANSDEDFNNALANAPFGDDTPLDVSGGALRTHDVAKVRSAEQFDRVLDDNYTPIGSGIFGSGEAIRVDGVGCEFDYDFDVPYTYGDATIAFRLYIPDDTYTGFDIKLDDSVKRTIVADQDPTPIPVDDPTWITTSVGSLSPGTHTVSIYFRDGSSGDGTLSYGTATLFDGDYTGVTNEDFSDGRPLSTPEIKPPSIDVQTDDVSTVRQVIAGRLEATVNSTARNQAIAISNDQGQNWIEASNAAVVDGAFASGTPRIRARFTLSNFDSGSGDVVYDSGTEIDLFDLFADLEDTPLIVQRLFEDNMVDVLNTAAESADAIWCVTCDQQGNFSVEWTQPGQREAAGDPTLVNYSAETDSSSINEKAIVYGTSYPVRDEEVTADLDTAVALPDDYLQETSEIVRATDSTRYERGVDYDFDPLAGEITARSGGAIADGETLVVDYSVKTRGTYELPSYSGDGKHIETQSIPGVTTQRSAEQAALIIVQKTSTPMTTATITIDEWPETWNLVDAVSIPDLPGDAMEVWSLSDEGGQVTLQLDSRAREEEVISTLKTQLSAVTREI